MKNLYMKDETRIDGGKFVFDIIDEGGRKLKFSPPLVIDWCVYKQIDARGDITTAYVNYDFGLTDKFKPYASISGGWGYKEITKDTPLSDIIRAFIEYDLFHAFYHYSGDPNYSHLHWALFGNLKEQTTMIEDYGDLENQKPLIDNNKEV